MSAIRNFRKHIQTHWQEWVDKKRDEEAKAARGRITHFRIQDRLHEETAKLVYDRINAYVEAHLNDMKPDLLTHDVVLKVPASVWPVSLDGLMEQHWTTHWAPSYGVPSLRSASERVRKWLKAEGLDCNLDKPMDWGAAFDLVGDHYLDDEAAPVIPTQ